MGSYLSSYYSIIFALTALLTLLLFYRVLTKSTSETTRKLAPLVFWGLFTWVLLQSFLSYTGVYYENTNSLPPRIVLLGVFPMLLVIILLFILSKGKQFLNSLPLLEITIVNSVRIPVELVLYWLFIHGFVPQLMTFEGFNFDILAGISSLFIAYFAFNKFKTRKKILLIWNFISLLLLLNIVIIAVLSVPSPFQQLSFQQPNIAILYFPFSLLPTFIVPIILFGHLVSIKQLINK